MPCNRFATSIEVWELQLLYTESAPRTTISAVQEEDDDAAGTEGGVYEALAAAAADIEASNDSGGAADVDIPKGVWLKKKAELLGWAKLRYFMLDVANAEFVYYSDSDGNGDGVERKGAIVLREVTAVDTDLEILIINTTDRNYELESKGAEEAATWAAHLKGVVDELHALDASIGSDAFSKDPVESVAGQPGAELEGRDAGSSASGSRSGSINGRSGTTLFFNREKRQAVEPPSESPGSQQMTKKPFATATLAVFAAFASGEWQCDVCNSRLSLSHLPQ